jgi:hypothetical protein
MGGSILLNYWQYQYKAIDISIFVKHLSSVVRGAEAGSGERSRDYSSLFYQNLHPHPTFRSSSNTRILPLTVLSTPKYLPPNFPVHSYTAGCVQHFTRQLLVRLFTTHFHISSLMSNELLTLNLSHYLNKNRINFTPCHWID